MSTSVIPLNLGMANAFVIKGQKSVLIDTGINLSEKRLLSKFRKSLVKPKEIDLIIITHGHTDHFAHIALLKKMTGARVLCHKLASHALQTGEMEKVIPLSKIGKLLSKFFKGKLKNYTPVTPDITIDEEFDLKPFGIEGVIIPTPGHSDCSISVILKDGDAVIGDIFVSGPFSPKKPSMAIFGNNETALKESISKILSFNTNVFYASHGGPYQRQSLIKLMNKQK